jgi:SAM-dependent methyltransferase
LEPGSDDPRARPRQTRFAVRDGVPTPDAESSLALLHGRVIGQWLHRNESLVRGRLLDVGCGNRPYAGWYESLATSVVATDVLPRPGIDVSTFAERLPFRAGAFDTVLMTEVLEHVPDTDAAVAELARVVRQGGHLLVTVPFLYPTHEPPYDFRRFTHFGLRDVLERNGFEVLSLDAKGGVGLLVAHYVTLGLRLGLMSVGRLDRRWAWALVTGPQQALAPLVGDRPGVRGTAALVSLGYMATARRR